MGKINLFFKPTFELYLMPAVSLVYNWPSLDLTAVSVLSSKQRKDIYDNMTHGLDFSHPIYPLPAHC